MSSRNFEARLADNTFKMEQVRIIHKSDPVPPPPLAYSKKIPLEDRKKIKKKDPLIIKKNAIAMIIIELNILLVIS